MDEQAYIEREAREDGEREYIERCRAEGRCVTCGGSKEIMVGWDHISDNPIFDTCEDCGGSGRADDSEQENAK